MLFTPHARRARALLALLATLALAVGCEKEGSSSAAAGASAGASAGTPAGAAAGTAAGAAAGTSAGTPAGEHAGACAPAGAEPPPAGAEPPPAQVASPRYDGVYVAAFSSLGVKVALARVRIQDGRLLGSILNRFGESFTLDGVVDEAGVLRAPPLTGSLGSVVIAQGRVDVLGRIEGSYTIGDGLGEDREGEFAGSLENRALSAPSPELDGLYDLSFIREGEEVAVTTLQVHGGRFSVDVVNREGLRFSAEGFVSEDGTVTLTSGRGTDFAVIAEGHIDADTHRIEGLYAVGALVGDVKGRRAD